MFKSKIDIPNQASILKEFDSVDYQDSYVMEVGEEVSFSDLLKHFLLAMPVWVRGLLLVRHLFAMAFGLDTDRPDKGAFNAFEGKVGQVLALFKVLKLEPNEMVTGWNDKHLDFRLSIYREKGKVYFNTVVSFNGWLGRFYFLPVRPMHVLIMILSLRNIDKRLRNGVSASW